MNKVQHIALLGSTGSIGTQALEVMRLFPQQFSPKVLTAGRNVDLLVQQAREFQPEYVVIAAEEKYAEVKEGLSDLPITVWAGADALVEVIEAVEVEVVLTALVGFAGLKPTLAALKKGTPIALANKETLVVAGEMVMELARAHNSPIIPIDSEHSALFQCMVGESAQCLEKIYLTASGGPFRGYSMEQLQQVTLAQALKHPNWSMGAKITIDSASMMNKGLEVIEARWLFDLEPDQIDVIVHPQSIIHSLVQFDDGSMKAQMGLPDMRLPIQYALTYPHRPHNPFPRFNFLDYPQLTFEPVDTDVFQNLRLAYEVMERGGNQPCVLNAANEESNRLFRAGQISFVEIAALNAQALTEVPFIAQPNLEQLVESDQAARIWVNQVAV